MKMTPHWAVGSLRSIGHVEAQHLLGPNTDWVGHGFRAKHLP
jgi:hypothetical protein